MLGYLTIYVEEINSKEAFKRVDWNVKLCDILISSSCKIEYDKIYYKDILLKIISVWNMCVCVSVCLTLRPKNLSKS